MIELPGSSALSNFRIKKLIHRLTAIEPRITGLTSFFVHFIDASRPLTEEETRVLLCLLTYGARAPASAAAPPGGAASAGELVLVMPRAGTISAWSSKASDIAHVCGLGAVRRIERGIAYRVQASRTLNREGLEPLTQVLFDRMTEMVLFEANDAAQLFRPRLIGG
jgi:phosphoribosylformylglycinamidine synthase